MEDLDGEQGKKLLALLDRKGIHGVAFLENGWRNFTCKKWIKAPEDVKEQKIRVMESPMYMGLISSMGVRRVFLFPPSVALVAGLVLLPWEAIPC